MFLDYLIDVLNAFKLFGDVDDKKKRLEMAVKEHGMNLSVGQRQLICF